MFTIPAVTEYKLNVRSLTISVYRAIRMGWTPEVIYGQDWPKSHYDPLVNKPVVKLKSARDFNTLAHRYSKVTGSIYRLAREEQTTEQWFAMYRKLTNQKEPAMNELTNDQLTRQDEVDNIVYEFINGDTWAVVPTINATYSFIKELAGSAASGVIEVSTAQIESVQRKAELVARVSHEWNIEHIAQVREAVRIVLVDELKLMTEMEFYPYLED